MADQERKPREDEQEQPQGRAQEPQTFDKQEAEKQETERERAEQEARERNLVGHALVQHFDGVASIMKDGLGDNPHYQPDPRLSIEENRALEIVYRVKVGQDEEGNHAAARTRKLLLNHALATLQPVLSVALAPELKPALESSYKEVQGGIEELREELATATLMQMHSGRSTLAAPLVDRVAAEDARAEELAQMGDLAWELVQLGKQRKRLRFSYDLVDHPVGQALGAIYEQASNLVAIAAKLARNAVKLGKAQADPERATRLQAEHDRLGQELAETVREFLAMCRADQTDADDVGAYPALRARFTKLVDTYGDVAKVDAALAAAKLLVEATDACVVAVDAIVAAEAGAQPKS